MVFTENHQRSRERKALYWRKIDVIKKEEDYWKRRYIACSIKLRENIDVKEIIKERDIIQHEYEKELEKNRILNQRLCFSNTQEHGYTRLSSPA